MPSELILIIDDDDDLRDALAEVLVDEGYRVQQEPGGLEALQALRRGLRPDLILLDLMMPGLDGQQFRKEQLADPKLADIPVLILTAGRQPLHTGAASPDRILTKPISMTDLQRMVAEQLAARRSR
jgi:CheY-like chemotaxis protein